MVPLLVGLTIIAFLTIELPPGDFLDNYIRRLEESGLRMDAVEVERLQRQYGLDKPAYVRYARWIWNIVTELNFGRSFMWAVPVLDVIAERIVLTIVIMLAPAMAWCPALLTAAPRRRRGCLSAAGAPGSLLAAAPPRPPFPQALPQFLELRTRRLQFLFQPLLSLYRLAMHSAVIARLPALL